MPLLEDLQNLVNELSATNSQNEKVKILSKYPQCKDILRYIYDPFKQFGVTSKNLQKMEGLESSATMDVYTFEDIFSMLDSLCQRRITGHTALFNVNKFILEHEDHRDLVYRILDKNLKTRTDASLINKAWKNLVPQFKVVLAKPYEDHAKKVNFEKDDWYVSRKLDGVRVLCVIQGGSIAFYSRAGKEFTTCQKIEEVLRAHKWDEDFVLDGEMCIIDEKGNENFTAVVSQIKRKDTPMENPVYKVFDYIPLEDFNNQKSPLHLVNRRLTLEAFVEEHLYPRNSDAEKRIQVLPHARVESLEDLQNQMAASVEAGWEGLMIRKNSPYEGKRTDKLLKVKQFYDDEYEVIDTINGKMSIADTVSNTEKEIETLSAVVIEHKGHRVKIGSGFSMADRERYFRNPELIVGKQITVRYFEESSNREGGISLRFPTVKKIWEEKRDI